MKLPAKANERNGHYRMKPNYRVRSHKKTERNFNEAYTMGDLLNNIEQFDDKIIYVWKENGEEKEISYKDFVHLVRSFACGIKNLVGTDRRVAVMGETSPYWIAAYMAIIASGNTAVPMDKELDPKEVENFLASVDTKAFVFSSTYNHGLSSFYMHHCILFYIASHNPQLSLKQTDVSRIAYIHRCSKNEKVKS